MQQSQNNSSRILKLKGEYYRHFSVDIAVPVEETALVPMHLRILILVD